MRFRVEPLILALSLFVVAACGGDGTTATTSEPDATADTTATTAGGETPGEETIRIAAVTGNFSNPAVKQMADAMVEEAANYPNVELIVQESANVEEQISKAETLIGSGIDIIALHPWEGETILAFEEQYSAQGVRFFNLIDDVPGAVEGGHAVSFISGDETEGGRVLGEWLTTQLDSGSIAIITGTPGNFAAQYRTDGFKEGISSNPDLVVVAESTADWQRDQALRVATDMLTANPDLAVFFANNDEMAFGALQALEAVGRKGEVVVIGYNGTCIGIEATLNGDFAADGILPIPEFGQEFVRNAVKVAQGEDVPPLIAPPILALDTAAAQAIADGSDTAVDPLLKARIDQAAGGNC